MADMSALPSSLGADDVDFDEEDDEYDDDDDDDDNDDVEADDYIAVNELGVGAGGSVIKVKDKGHRRRSPGDPDRYRWKVEAAKHKVVITT